MLQRFYPVSIMQTECSTRRAGSFCSMLFIHHLEYTSEKPPKPDQKPPKYANLKIKNPCYRPANATQQGKCQRLREDHQSVQVESTSFVLYLKSSRARRGSTRSGLEA
jgi:hypothetical protein